MIKNSFIKKNIGLFATTVLLITMLSGCGEEQVTADHTNVFTLSELTGGSQLTVSENDADGVGIASSEDSDPVKIAEVFMTTEGKPVKDDDNSAICVGALGSMLVYSNEKWVITHDATDSNLSISYEYKVSDESVITVDENGVLNPLKVGEVNIYEYKTVGLNKTHTGWYSVKIIEPHEHIFTRKENPCSCTEKGWVEYVCLVKNEETGSICNKTKGYVEVAARGHNYAVAGTSYYDGYDIVTYRCTRCGDTYTNKVL